MPRHWYDCDGSSTVPRKPPEKNQRSKFTLSQRRSTEKRKPTIRIRYQQLFWQNTSIKPKVNRHHASNNVEQGPNQRYRWSHISGGPICFHWVPSASFSEARETGGCLFDHSDPGGAASHLLMRILGQWIPLVWGGCCSWYNHSYHANGIWSSEVAAWSRQMCGGGGNLESGSFEGIEQNSCDTSHIPRSENSFVQKLTLYSRTWKLRFTTAEREHHHLHMRWVLEGFREVEMCYVPSSFDEWIHTHTHIYGTRNQGLALLYYCIAELKSPPTFLEHTEIREISTTCCEQTYMIDRNINRLKLPSIWGLLHCYILAYFHYVEAMSI